MRDSNGKKRNLDALGAQSRNWSREANLNEPLPGIYGEETVVLELGDYLLKAYSRTLLDGWSDGKVLYFEKRLSVLAGNHYEEIPVPVLHNVRIEFPSQYHGKSAVLSQGLGRRIQEGKLTADLELRLPSGEYQLYLWPESMLFEVSSDLTLPFVNARYTALVLTSVPDQGPYSKLGLQKGDIILTINGEPINTEQPRRHIFERLQNLGSLRLSVVRGEEIFDVTLNHHDKVRRLGFEGCFRP